MNAGLPLLAILGCACSEVNAQQNYLSSPDRNVPILNPIEMSSFSVLSFTYFVSPFVSAGVVSYAVG
ncbi:MAG: hypothetical protein ACLQNE_22855, partial [Thermoguttaceae bacterium]